MHSEMFPAVGGWPVELYCRCLGCWKGCNCKAWFSLVAQYRWGNLKTTHDKNLTDELLKGCSKEGGQCRFAWRVQSVFKCSPQQHQQPRGGSRKCTHKTKTKVATRTWHNKSMCQVFLPNLIAQGYTGQTCKKSFRAMQHSWTIQGTGACFVEKCQHGHKKHVEKKKTKRTAKDLRRIEGEATKNPSSISAAINYNKNQEVRHVQFSESWPK